MAFADLPKSSSPPLNPETVEKDRNSHHFVGQSIHMLARLRDHINRMDTGVPHAVDDLAVVLRALLSPSRGCDILRRMYAVLGTQPYEVLLSRPPKTSGVFFSVGSIPARVTDEHDGRETGAVYVPLEDWPNTPVLTVLIAGKTTTYSWAKLLSEYANKWGGAHLDSEVPTYLYAIDRYATGGFQLSGYLLRTAGAYVWQIGQRLLAEMVKKREGLEDAEVVEQVTITGDSGEAPSERLHFGELQWLDYTGEETSFLHFHEANKNFDFRIVAGKITYEVSAFADGVEPTERPLHAPRNLVKTEVTESDFSEGKTMRVHHDFRALVLD